MRIITLNEMIFSQKALYLVRRMYAAIHIRRPLPSIDKPSYEKRDLYARVGSPAFVLRIYNYRCGDCL